MAIKTISEDEQRLLEEVAKSKGKSLAELLEDLGHNKPPATVELEGTQPEPVMPEPKYSPPPPAAPPPVVPPAAPEAVFEGLPQFENGIEPEIEPPFAGEEVLEEEAEPQEADKDAATPATLRQVCVQCGWDQEQPAIPEPEQQDKIAFLHAVLGQKVFSKRYATYGNRLRMTFRTLTIREIDALYQETFRAQKREIVTTPADYYEFLNRLRLYLQLTSLSSSMTAMQIKLPEGLTRETHPDAASYWEDFLKNLGVYQDPAENKPDTPTLLMQIQDYVLGNVLKTEHLQRAVTHTCGKFNQLVVKLESCANNPDFWNETGPQS